MLCSSKTLAADHSARNGSGIQEDSWGKGKSIHFQRRPFPRHSRTDLILEAPKHPYSGQMPNFASMIFSPASSSREDRGGCTGSLPFFPGDFYAMRNNFQEGEHTHAAGL